MQGGPSGIGSRSGLGSNKECTVTVVAGTVIAQSNFLESHTKPVLSLSKESHLKRLVRRGFEGLFAKA